MLFRSTILKTVQAGLIVGIDNVKFNSLEEKLEHYNDIDIKYWTKYNEIVESYGNFGIESKVKVISPLSHKSVIRRFQFRYLDFLQAMDIQDSSEYAVSFGN